jgi:DNA-binding CsgD family transcriptional regulator
MDLDDPLATEGLDIDDVLPPEDCLACRHPKLFHYGDGVSCRAKNDSTNTFCNVPGFNCWCPSFTNDPKQASAQILAHGDGGALTRGIKETLARSDHESAQRLLDRYIDTNPKEQRDLVWVVTVNRQIAELSKRRAFRTPYDGLHQSMKKVPATQYMDDAKLTQRQYDCFSLLMEYQLPMGEIERRMGITRKTIHEHVEAAKRRIQEKQSFHKRYAQRARTNPERLK